MKASGCAGFVSFVRCGRCGGNLYRQWDYATRRCVTQCLACGREA